MMQIGNCFLRLGDLVRIVETGQGIIAFWCSVKGVSYNLVEPSTVRIIDAHAMDPPTVLNNKR